MTVLSFTLRSLANKAEDTSQTCNWCYMRSGRYLVKIFGHFTGPEHKPEYVCTVCRGQAQKAWDECSSVEAFGEAA